MAVRRSQMSAPMLAGGIEATLRAPPRARATGVSGYSVRWGAPGLMATPQCGLDVRWRLEYSRATAAQESHQGQNQPGSWHALVDDTLVTTFEPRLVCPEGCSFRAAALNVAGWPEVPTATEFVPTPRGTGPYLHGGAGDKAEREAKVGQHIVVAGLALAAAFVCCVGFRQLRDRSSLPPVLYERGAATAGMDAPMDDLDDGLVAAVCAQTRAAPQHYRSSATWTDVTNG